MQQALDALERAEVSLNAYADGADWGHYDRYTLNACTTAMDALRAALDAPSESVAQDALHDAAQAALESLEGFLRFMAVMNDGPDASDKLLAEDHAEGAFIKAVAVVPVLRAALAVDAAPAPVAQPVAYADEVSFRDAMRSGKGCDVWSVPGDYEQRTGRKLIALAYAAPAPVAPDVSLIGEVKSAAPVAQADPTMSRDELVAAAESIGMRFPPAPAPVAQRDAMCPHQHAIDDWQHFEGAIESSAVPAPVAPLNLADSAVQRRLAAQWGYVPAAHAPVAQPDAAPALVPLTGQQIVACWGRTEGTRNGYGPFALSVIAEFCRVNKIGGAA
ncbi:MAG: hypothetical protein AB9M53_01105 [Leptothrix sp. (in: b-proteobacteria)]